MNRLVDRIEELSQAFGPSGFEEPVRSRIAAFLEESGVPFETDTLGNLTATLEGKDGCTVMIDAHMDEVGILVNHVEAEGWLRFVPLGGWDPRLFPGQQVELMPSSGEPVWGVIGTAPPHVQSSEEQKKPYRVEDLFIDIGVRSPSEAEAMGIRIGTPGVLCAPFRRLRNGLFTGKALDDRIGCALLLALVDHFSEHPPEATLKMNFAVHEEVGARGAATAAYRIRPDVAVAVEATTADTPGVPPHLQPARLGDGPAVTLADRSLMVKPAMVESILDLARSEDIPVQIKRPIWGGTDAGAIHVSREGILTAVISVPCRYLHSPVTVAFDPDVGNTFRLLRILIERIRSIADRCAS